MHVFKTEFLKTLSLLFQIEVDWRLPLPSEPFDMWIVRVHHINIVLTRSPWSIYRYYIDTVWIVMDDVEVPFKGLLEHKHPEVYEYIKNAVRMLQRQQNLLAKIKNSNSIDFKVILNHVCIRSRLVCHIRHSLTCLVWHINWLCIQASVLCVTYFSMLNRSIYLIQYTYLFNCNLFQTEIKH